MRDPAMGEPLSRLTRMRYDMGPMGFLSDQIMKEMQRAGYPVREFNLYRSPLDQDAARIRGASRARAYQSAHQFYAAADIIHERWAWFAAPDAPDGTQFWARLWDCVEVVSEKYGVEFDERLPWDAAHIELKGWKAFRDVLGTSKPNGEWDALKPSQQALDWYFQVTLPNVWKQHQRAMQSQHSDRSKPMP